ncbi:MAG TPA: TlpA disulfide reductase family protein [Burkholderiales bacterium]
MSRSFTLIGGSIIVLAALAAGLYFGYSVRVGEPKPTGRTVLLHTPFTDLTGNQTTLAQWQGKRLLVNFWATWCTPCREEMPLLNRMHAQYAANGVEFVGIAVDSPEPVQKFVQQLGIGYPIVTGGADALEVIRLLGNKAGGLPYTVLVEPDGRISRTLLGQIHEQDLLEWLGQPHAPAS